jgi:ABC-type antimicrobial peptide transport system permease subunit
MGVRLALGADRAVILQMVIMRGLVLAGAGVGIGVAASLLLTRVIANLLYGVTPSDPVTFFGVPIALIAMAILASYIPARRAANVDPIVALRYE